MRYVSPLFFAFLFSFSSANAQVVLQQFASGFERPCDIAHCGDSRLFVVEQRGYIWILDKNGNKLQPPFLNIDPIVGFTGNERGLLGLAFHPNYPQTPYFYVNYTDNSGNTKVSRFSVSATNPNEADPASEQILLSFTQPFSNHNGGGVKFGPDGYLYIGSGDGGSGGDPQANGQKRTTLLGKMLRIDIDNGTPYSVPASNPFVNDASTLDEIWALGLRNPWRFSFDRVTGDLWIGDVGQDNWEEIDFQPANSPGGENYGWRCYEGDVVYNNSGCPSTNELTFPVAVYANTNAIGCSVTGGFVYRGFTNPQLYGKYLYTDYCTGRLWSITKEPNGTFTNVQIADFINGQLASFGENISGELFLTGNSNGIIYRLVDNTDSWAYNVNVLNPACPGTSDGYIQIVFPTNTPAPTITWNDGATGPLRTDLPDGTYTATIVGANGSIAYETVVIAPTVSLSIIVSDETCPNAQDGAIGIVVLGSPATPPATANWSDGATGLERIELDPGPYSVTVTTAEGCVFTEDFNVVTLLPGPMPTISQQANNILMVNETYDAYQWFLNGVEIPGATANIYDPFSDPNFTEGTFNVQVTDGIGCKAFSDTIFIESTAARTIAGIKSVDVSPNPFTQRLRLEVTVSEPLYLQLSLSDMQGKVVLTDRLAVTSTTTRQYDLSKLPSGTYLLILKNGKGEWVERVVKL